MPGLLRVILAALGQIHGVIFEGSRRTGFLRALGSKRAPPWSGAPRRAPPVWGSAVQLILDVRSCLRAELVTLEYRFQHSLRGSELLPVPSFVGPKRPSTLFWRHPSESVVCVYVCARFFSGSSENNPTSSLSNNSSIIGSAGQI